MISILCLYFLIFFRITSNVGATVIGTFGCDCFGELRSQCNISVPIDSFPKECTSFLYDGLIISSDSTVADHNLAYNDVEGYMDKLADTGKNVILYIAHASEPEWVNALTCDPSTGELKAKAEVKNIQDFLGQHKGIKGLAIYNLDMVRDSVEFPDFTQNLITYIGMLRSSIPGLEVGISLYVRSTIYYFQGPKVNWLDFKVLDPSIDFYIINLNNLNDCESQFVHDGIYPLTGDTYNTVDMAKTYLQNAGVSTTKLYMKYILSAYPMDTSLPFCQSYYTSFCVDPKDAQSLCADTIQSLTEKGKYAKDNCAGFVMNTIDLDDFDGCSCQCGRTYPGFHALVDGYNGAPPPPPCARFDRS